jgi:hypothetical protein
VVDCGLCKDEVGEELGSASPSISLPPRKVCSMPWLLASRCGEQTAARLAASISLGRTESYTAMAVCILLGWMESCMAVPVGISLGLTESCMAVAASISLGRTEGCFAALVNMDQALP